MATVSNNAIGNAGGKALLVPESGAKGTAQRVTESVTKSLDQIVAKKRADSAMGAKKKAMEAAEGNVAAYWQLTRFVEHHGLQGTLHHSLAGKTTVATPGQGGMAIAATELGQHDNAEAKPQAKSVGQPEGKAATPAPSSLAQAVAMEALQPAPLQPAPLQPAPQKQQDSLHLNKEEGQRLSTTKSADLPHTGQARQTAIAPMHAPLSSSGVMTPNMAMGESRESEKTAVTLPLTAAVDAANTLQDKAAKSADSALPDHARFARPEASQLKMMTPAATDAAQAGKLVYRFAEWGEGHQVNVQLAGHVKTPHVLQPSDTLVQQRLSDYDGQAQSEQEWVFSDDESQQRKGRDQKQQPDEEAS